MMSRADDIADRLPHFYMTWNGDSAITTLIRSMASALDHTETDLIEILRSHWVDTARGNDLDRLGLMLSTQRKIGEGDLEYRGRLKTAIIGYSGGGTLNSIRIMIRIALGLPEDYPIDIVENPRENMKKSWTVPANGEWTVDPVSISSSQPRITFAVETPDVEINNPTITNVDTGESVTFNGRMARGDVLNLYGGRAILNGADRTSALSSTAPLTLPRGRTRWKYTEAVGSNLGVFDLAQFDKSVFAVEIATKVTFEWSAYLPATFEVHIPSASLERVGARPEYVQGLLDSLKASGVKGTVKVV
jgi:hypothetical protein